MSGAKDRDHLNGISTDSLWNYAVETYGRPGAQEVCLLLQDAARVDVNVLLSALYATYISGACVEAGLVERMDSAIRAWREQVVVPLRHIRRTMKTGARIGKEGDAEALRNSIKALELKAERIELAELAVVLGTMGPSAGRAGEDDFMETIARVVCFYGPEQPPSHHQIERAKPQARAAGLQDRAS